MHPILIHIRSLTIYSFGILASVGLLISLFYARYQASRQGLDPIRIWRLGIYVIVAGVACSKFWLVVFDRPEAFTSAGSASILRSGGAFYGGVVGAVLVMGAVIFTWKLPILDVFDAFAVSLPLGHAVGRLGCFAAGCCYGKATSLPWGVVFRSEVANHLVGTPLNVRLHPTQLYESGAEIINFVLLLVVWKKCYVPGRLVGLYFVLYGIERCIIEVFRGDPGRTMMFGDSFSLMQLISICLVTVGIILLTVRKSRQLAPIP